MKKLQNNYTTPEQSKRLLELGVPADSADCFLTEINRMYYLASRTYGEQEKLEKRNGGKPTPCWSVGRLIEIVKICSNLASILGYQIAYNTRHKTNLLRIVIQVIEDYINEIDFSKLEE